MPIPIAHPPQSRVGNAATALAVSGVMLFSAFSPISIAVSQIAWGICVLGLIIGFASGAIRYRPTPLDLPFLLYIIVDIASVLSAVDRHRSARAILGDWTFLYFPVFAQAFRNSRDVRRAFGTLFITSTAVAAYAFWQMFEGKDLLRGHPLEPIGGLFLAIGLFGHHLTYGGNVLMTALLALVFASRSSSGRMSAFLLKGIAAVVQIAGVVATFARTAWLGVAAGIVTTLLIAKGALRWIAASALAASVALALFIPAVRDRFLSVGGMAGDARVHLWQTALRIWRDHPILGTGPGSFGPLFPIYKVPGEYMATGHPHNDFLNILVQSGIIGLLAFIFIWVRFFTLMWRARKIAGRQDARGVVLTAGVVIVVGFFVGAMGQCLLTDEEVGMLFWFIVAGSVAVAREVMETGRAAGDPGAA